MFEGNPKKLSSILALYLLFSIVIFSVSLLMWTYNSTRYLVDQAQISIFDRMHSIAEHEIIRQLELIDNALSKISGNERFSDAISNESLSVVRKIIDDFFCYDTGNQLDILFICRSDNTVWLDASSQFFHPGPILQKIASNSSDILAFGSIERFKESGVDLTLLLKALPIVNNESGKVLGTLFGGTVLDDNLSILETIRQKSHSKAVFFLESNDLIASTELADSILIQLVLGETDNNCPKIFHINYGAGKNMPQGLICRCKPFVISGNSDSLNIVTAILDEVPAGLRRSYLQTGMILILFTLVFVFFSVLIIQKLTVSPLKSLLNYTDAISQGFFDSDYENGPIVEFNDVGHEMKRMVESLKNINELLKQDIEARKKTELELKEATNIINSSQTVAFLWRNQKGWPVEFVSDNVSALFGYTAKEFRSGNLLYSDIIYPEDLDGLEKEIKALLQSDDSDSIVHSPYRIITKGGKVKWLENKTFIRKDADQKVSHFQGIVEDISEKIEAEHALRRSEERYRSLHSNVPVGVFRSTPNGKMLSANPAFLKMLKLSSEKEILSQSILNFYSDPNQRKIFIQRLKKEGKINGFEVRLKRVDKTEFWGSISATRVVDKKGEFIHIDGIVEDISQRKNAVKEKRKLERQLRQAQKMEAIGTLAGGIAHDFNNILSAIIGFTELAQFECGSDYDSCINEYLKEVLQAGKRAKELVKQILAFSRQGEQDIKPIYINVILKEALKLIRASLPSTIEIVQDICDDVAIMGDPTQIHQVIMNLCTNAAHAMQDKGGTLEIQLKLVKMDAEYSAKHVGTEPGSYLNLVVSDSGHGMPSHVLERIFDPFFTTKKNGEGTGMGLSVVHGIIKSHGGFVTAYSHPGMGSTFNIFLPAIESVFEKETTEEAPVSGGNERILLVDDEPSITIFEKQMLESMGYHIRTRNSSTEALRLFRSMPEAFDLVITDMTMPKMTGEQLSKEIKAIRPEIPIILRTGFSAAINESMAKGKGISAYMMKPILRCDMARTIRKVLDRR